MKYLCIIFVGCLTILSCNKSKTPTDIGDPSAPYQFRFDIVENSTGKKVSTWNANVLRASYNINFFRQKVLFIHGDSSQYRLSITLAPNCQATGELPVTLSGCCTVSYTLDSTATAAFADIGKVNILRLTDTEVEGRFDDINAQGQSVQYSAKNGYFKAKIEQ